MGIISRMRRQKAVYWEPATRSDGAMMLDNYGDPIYLAPVEIDCRWDDAAQEFSTPEGETTVSNSIVYPDRELKIKGLLLETVLDAVERPLNPVAEGAREIRQTGKTPNLRATETLYTAWL
jgi:hypothetical protein